MLSIQISVGIFCLLLMAYVIRLVVKKRLRLKYSLLWLALSLVALLCAIFPEPLFALAHLLGFVVPSNLVFFLAIFFLLVLCLSLTVIVSWQARDIRQLIQEIAVINNQLENLCSEEKTPLQEATSRRTDEK